MQNAVIVDIVRSPMGRGKTGGGGCFESLHPVELLRQVITGIVDRNDLDPESVADVIVGCVSQGGEQAYSPGRMAWLGAGYPESVPSVTIDRKCGSAQQAVHFAAASVMSGMQDIVLAGGIESMSRVPMGSARMGKDPMGSSANARYAPGFTSQGVGAELIAARWGISRRQMDEYAARSHSLAAELREAGHFNSEIVPITVDTEDGGHTVTDDETIRAGTTADGLANLRTAFNDDVTKERFPEIEWSVTAGNSSQLTDGAAMALIMSEERANALNLTPRARFAGFDVMADDPIKMLTAPIPVTKRLLKKTGMNINDIDHHEVNEAFASVPLAWQRDLDSDPEKLNPAGGAIALGHPLGASGVRLMATMLNAMERNNQRYGLQTMCEAGGMANATIIERY